MIKGIYVVFDIESGKKREIAKRVRLLTQEIELIVTGLTIPIEPLESTFVQLADMSKQSPPSIVALTLHDLPWFIKSNPFIVPFLSLSERLSMLTSN